MKITHVEIRNFRALKHINTPLEQLSIILGENDSGKTSLLYALEKFFSRKKLNDPSDWFNREKNQPIEITLSFGEAPSELSESSEDGSIKIKATFAFDQTPKYEFLPQGRKVPTDVMKTHFSENHFSLVPVSRNIAEHFSMGKSSLLGKMIRRRMSHAIQEENSGQTSLEEIIKILEESIETPRTTIEGLLREQLKNESIELEFGNLDIDPVEGVSFRTQLSDSGAQKIDIANRGAGTQSNLIIALFRFIADSDMAKDFILCLEEPENSLHPKAQRRLLSAIQDISDKTQVIVTTHSPVFIDRSHYQSNVIFSRKTDGHTVARTFKKSKFPDVIQKELGIRASDALLKGGGNCALLVEGKTEEDGFPIFMEMAGVNESELGVSIISMGGSDETKARAIIKLLGCYGIPCVVVLDKDAQQTQKGLERNPSQSSKNTDDKKQLTNLKKVFVLEKGSIEDYYPADIIAQVINDKHCPTSKIKAEKIPTDLSGKDRLNHISQILHEHKAHNIEFLKLNLGGYGTKLMQKRSEPLDKEIQKIIDTVKSIATEDG